MWKIVFYSLLNKSHFCHLQKNQKDEKNLIKPDSMKYREGWMHRQLSESEKVKRNSIRKKAHISLKMMIVGGVSLASSQRERKKRVCIYVVHIHEARAHQIESSI